MHKLFLLLCFISPAAFAQNVGIGTSTPVAKLNIVGSSSNAAIPGLTSAAVFRIGINDAEGIDFGKMGTAPYSAWMQAGINGTVSDPISLQPAGGNVGIGIISPTAKLHINGSIKLEGLNLFEFGAGVAGKELNAGKVGYNAFGQNALTFVGAGTNITNRAVYFFAEGGTTFTGPLDFYGPLRPGGAPGTAGQVLRSNGASNPVWANAALDNNIRFGVLFSTTTEGSGAINVESTQYNLSPADITIGTGSITVNKTGLYHINAQVTSRVLTAAPTSYVPEGSAFVLFSSGATTINYFIMGYLDHYQESMSDAGAGGSYYHSKWVEGDVYLTAGMTIRVTRDLRVEGTPGDVIFDVYLYGHLVDD